MPQEIHEFWQVCRYDFKECHPCCVGELDRWEGSQKHNSYLIKVYILRFEVKQYVSALYKAETCCFTSNLKNIHLLYNIRVVSLTTLPLIFVGTSNDAYWLKRSHTSTLLIRLLSRVPN